MIGRVLAAVSGALLAALLWTAAPAFAWFQPMTLERAFFRTVTLLYPAAPRETVAAATQCMVGASASFPESAKQALIEMDRRPVYRGDARMEAIVEAIFRLDPAVTQPLATCFDRMRDGAFGATTGSIPATSAPNPDNVAACPIRTEQVSGRDLTCYCQPMLGGIAYGNRTYADISSICLAARHAGAMDYLTGGVVHAVFEPGCASYEGVEENGALSATQGRTARSFHFPVVGKGACPK